MSDETKDQMEYRLLLTPVDEPEFVTQVTHEDRARKSYAGADAMLGKGGGKVELQSRTITPWATIESKEVAP